MRSRPLLSIVAGMLLLGAGASEAGVLTAATWLQVIQGVPMTRTTAQLGVAGSSTAGSIGVSLSYPQFTTSFFVPKTVYGVLDLHIKVTQGGAQAITATPSMGNGSPGIDGMVTVRTFTHADAGANASMFMAGVILPGYPQPLSNGMAGQFTTTFFVIADHQLTIDFFAWTPHTLSFMDLTSFGGALPDVVAMGSFDLTANGGGTVTLVSPSKLSINGSLGQRRTATFTTLELHFVPEPSTLLLLAAGALGLVSRAGLRRAEAWVRWAARRAAWPRR